MWKAMMVCLVRDTQFAREDHDDVDGFFKYKLPQPSTPAPGLSPGNHGI